MQFQRMALVSSLALAAAYALLRLYCSVFGGGYVGWLCAFLI